MLFGFSFGICVRLIPGGKSRASTNVLSGVWDQTVSDELTDIAHIAVADLNKDIGL